MSSKGIAKTIDHSLLHPALTSCPPPQSHRMPKVAAVRVKANSIPLARRRARRLEGVLISAAIGLPHGGGTATLAELLEPGIDVVVHVRRQGVLGAVSSRLGSIRAAYPASEGEYRPEYSG
ncbi:hypothetical protein GGS24DRAFT_506098 [Hypoxylon argillaceum]|nr:hypothetical protein GGS24DRAFT_506098 [Hypoxylon argillaceum]